MLMVLVMCIWINGKILSMESHISQLKNHKDIYSYFRPIPIPADPISIAIALRSSYRSRVPEDQLAYGFKKKPLDQQRIKNYPDIPEEKLFNVNAQVIEFKKPSFDSEEEEDEDEFEDDGFKNKKEQVTSFGSTYTDLGYYEVEPTYRKYLNIPISTTPFPRLHLPHECAGRVVDVSHENDDYRPAESAERCSIHEFPLTR